jgi:hypothetical protein
MQIWTKRRGAGQGDDDPVVRAEDRMGTDEGESIHSGVLSGGHLDGGVQGRLGAM